MTLCQLLLLFIVAAVPVGTLYIDNSASNNHKHKRAIPYRVEELSKNATEQEEDIGKLEEDLRSQCIQSELQSRHTYLMEESLFDPIPQAEDGFLKITEADQVTQNSNAKRAIDGNSNSYYPSGTCTHTDDSSSAKFTWWQGKLNNYAMVRSIKITNRGDCCSDRLKGFVIQCFDKNPKIYTDQKPKICAEHPSAVGNGETKTIPCDPPCYALYLRLYQNGSAPLTICEFVAEGKTALDLEDLRNVYQSFNNHEKDEVSGWRALDRDVETCTETDPRDVMDHYWQLDFRQLKTVNGVSITNRMDDKADFLRDITVSVYEDRPSDLMQVTDQHVCAERAEKVGKGEKVTLTCTNPVRGQFLRIWKKNKPGETLSLCEVEINTQE